MQAMRKRWAGQRMRRVVGSVLMVLGAASVAGAQTIPVANGDFEEPVLQPGSFTQATPTGWTLFAGSTTNTGVFHPTVASWQYVAPSGHQLLYLNGATVEQTLAANAQQGQTYLLAVDVVRRPGFWNPNYRIDFFAGSVLLGTDFASLVPENGGSKVSLIQYVVGPGDPAIGQALRIRLGGPTQTNFDNVRVFVPEPGLGLGLGAAIPAALWLASQPGRRAGRRTGRRTGERPGRPAA